MIKNKQISKLINSSTSLKVVSLFMLISIFVCCLVSIFCNNQVLKSEVFSGKNTGKANQFAVEHLSVIADNLGSSDLTDETSLSIPNRISRKTKCSNFEYGSSLVGVNSLNDQLALKFYSVLQRKGQNFVHTMIENIGISERFQV